MPKYQVTLTEVQRKILSLWRDGKTGSHIAFELKMTRSAVMGQLNRLRIKGHVDYKMPERKKNAPVPEKIILPTPRAGQVLSVKEPVVLPEPNTTELIMATVIEKLTPAKKDGLKIPFTSLTRRSCRYPVSGKGPDDYLFCGEERMDGKPYCAEHRALCYVPRSTTKRIQSLATNFRRKHGPAHP